MGWNNYNSTGNSEVQAKWNMDEAQLKRIDYLLTLSTSHFQNWNIEELYWVLRSIRREINAKLRQKEKEQLDSDLETLSKQRTEFLRQRMTKGDFFINCEKFYMALTDLIKKHGIYFRENEDVGL